MTPDELKQRTVAALEDLKARDIQVLDVRGLTGVTDFMVVACGTSARHVKSLADNVELELKQAGVPVLGVEGQNASADWVLVDFGDVVVHIMMPEARSFYDLESLWAVAASRPDAH